MNHRSIQQTCSECQRKRDRCRAVATTAEGEIIYVCRACFRDFDYEKYLYEYREEKGYGPGV